MKDVIGSIFPPLLLGLSWAMVPLQYAVYASPGNLALTVGCAVFTSAVLLPGIFRRG